MILKNAETAKDTEPGEDGMGDQKRALLERLGFLEAPIYERQSRLDEDGLECEFCHSCDAKCTDALRAHACTRLPPSERVSLNSDF